MRMVNFSLDSLTYGTQIGEDIPASYASILAVSQNFRLNRKQHASFVRGAIFLLREWCMELNISTNDLPMALKQLPAQEIIHIVGPAGYGKSVIIKTLQYFCSSWNRSDSIIITSFTASAAQNAGGINIHALFGWSPVNETKSPNDFVKNSFRRCRLLIFDEVSAIPQPLIGNVSITIQLNLASR